VECGSGNVFTDLGFPDADAHLVKAGLVSEIDDIVCTRGMTQTEAVRLIGLSQPDMSRLVRGDVREHSPERLFRPLTALGRNVDIVIRQPRFADGARLRIAAAEPAARSNAQTRCRPVHDVQASIGRTRTAMDDPHVVALECRLGQGLDVINCSRAAPARQGRGQLPRAGRERTGPLRVQGGSHFRVGGPFRGQSRTSGVTGADCFRPCHLTPHMERRPRRTG